MGAADAVRGSYDALTMVAQRAQLISVAATLHSRPKGETDAQHINEKIDAER
jgi:hypothetical protein